MFDFEPKRKPRYPGVRWRLVYGSYEGVERFAVDEWQRILQTYEPYVIPVSPPDVDLQNHEDNILLCGTVENNRHIRRLVELGLLTIPDQPEGYAAGCVDSPWKPGRKVLAVGGHDPNGVLYGVVDLNTRKLGMERIQDDPTVTRKLLDEMPPFSLSEYPRVAGRGLWTWGYVIYDYRRYLDNMARLRMNTLTVWNDCPPVNMAEVIEAAHRRGIRVVMGFHWGWGTVGLDLADPAHVDALRDHVLETYRRDYADLPHDGIYFQTLTEHNETHRDGVPLARLVCRMVNRIGSALLERYPGLDIQCGLHATSILEHYSEFEALDPRITITWEDAGVIPYSYHVVEHYDDAPYHAKRHGTVEATIAYSRKLAALRPGSRFAFVPKGFSDLRWRTEYEHHGPFILGERSARFIRNRLDQRQAMWDAKSALWLRNAPHVVRFFREIFDVGPSAILATALCEDGLFEQAIQPAIALFSHLIWNPTSDLGELPPMAFSSYYRETT